MLMSDVSEAEKSELTVDQKRKKNASSHQLNTAPWRPSV